MGKLAFWILLALAALLLFKLFGSAKRAPKGREAGQSGRGRDAARREAGEAAGPTGELMMSCAVCGVHLPGSEAVFARGRVYCSAEHRDQDRGGGNAP